MRNLIVQILYIACMFASVMIKDPYGLAFVAILYIGSHLDQIREKME